MTITQTIEVPANRRVFFEFLAPQEIPTGKAKVEMKLTPVVEKHKEHSSETVFKYANEKATPHTDALLDIISKIDGDINLEEIRMERLAKHLK